MVWRWRSFSFKSPPPPVFTTCYISLSYCLSCRVVFTGISKFLTTMQTAALTGAGDPFQDECEHCYLKTLSLSAPALIHTRLNVSLFTAFKIRKRGLCREISSPKIVSAFALSPVLYSFYCTNARIRCPSPHSTCRIWQGSQVNLHYQFKWALSCTTPEHRGQV